MRYVTHKGLFHADEVTGWAIARLSGTCGSLHRVDQRSYVPSGDELIADIMGVYDPALRRFDHHQATLPRKEGPGYATAGLLWEHYGMEVLKKLVPAGTCDLARLHNDVEKAFIWQVDAHDADSGWQVGGHWSGGGQVEVTTFSNIVSSFNTDDITDDHAQYIAFMEAAGFTERLLKKEILKWASIGQACENFVNKAQIKPGYAVLSEQMNWKNAVHEHNLKASVKLLYVVLPSYGHGNSHCLMAVPERPSGRRLLRPIERPDWFEGFIHNGKFIAGGTFGEMCRLAEHNLARA